MRVSAGARPHGRAGTRTPMARLACRLGKFAAFCRTYTWLEIIARRGAATDHAKLARNLQLRSRTHKPDLALISFRIFWHSSLMPSTHASMVVGLCIWCGCVQRTPQSRQATTQRTMQETRTHPRESAATCLVAASRCAHRQPAAAAARAARRHAQRPDARPHAALTHHWCHGKLDLVPIRVICRCPRRPGRQQRDSLARSHGGLSRLRFRGRLGLNPFCSLRSS